MFSRLAFVVLLLTGASACRERMVQTPLLVAKDQYAYFPLETGRYIDYTVDSLIFDFNASGGTTIDTVRVYVREMVGDTFRDLTGLLMYQMERYERAHPDDPWTIKHVWSAGRTETQAIRTENNQRFLKLVFPMEPRTRWNGNLWIDDQQEIEIAGEPIRPFANWRYQVDEIDVFGSVGIFNFDSLLTVTEVDENNIIERRWSVAQYAKNIGLVRREQWILDSQYCNKNPVPADCTTKPWEEKAEKGYIVRQTVVGWD